MRLRLAETNLSREERELRHFLASFLPQGGLVKLRQCLQLGLGEFVGISGDRLLLDALPIQVCSQKPLQDLPLRRELRIVLHLVVHDLCDDLRQALINLQHEEQVLRRLAMALFVSQSDDRGEPQGNCDQARAQQSSHDSILLRNTYTTCRRRLSKEKRKALFHHHSRTGSRMSSCWMRYRPTCATAANALVISSGGIPLSLRYVITPSSSSPQKMPSMK